MLNIITNGYVLPFLSKPSLVRFPLILSEYKAHQKDQALATCIQSLLSKNAIERVENVKSLGFYSRLFLVPKPHQRWRPVIDLSRLNTFSTCRKVQTGNSRVHQDLPDSRGVGFVDRSDADAYLHIPIHPDSRKYLRFCYKSQVFQFTSLPFGLATAPQVFTMIVKEVKLMALSRGLRVHQYLDNWLIRSQSQEEAQVNTQAVVDLTQSLGWIINQKKSELKPTQVFSFVGYEYHLDSALVKPTQERWLKLQVLLRYNSLPCGTECFTGCREELRPTSKKKRHLFLAIASGCRHVICPFVSTFLVGRRHFTVFGKYLLPFSSYISVQFYGYTSLFMYFIYYCIKHILANFQHFRFCNLSLF